MTLYVQYDSLGNIRAMVCTTAPAPVCDNQLALDDATSTAGMMVDTINKVLVAIPTPPPGP